MKIKYWSASGSGFPPSLIPALRNIGILHHKKAELRILLQHSVWASFELFGALYMYISARTPSTYEHSICARNSAVH